MFYSYDSSLSDFHIRDVIESILLMQLIFNFIILPLKSSVLSKTVKYVLPSSNTENREAFITMCNSSLLNTL